jgi:hypothetical protein
MARLLATQACAQLLHRLMDVLIANGGALKHPTLGLPGTLKAEIGHHRGNNAIGWQLARIQQPRSPEIKNLVAVHHPAPAIDCQHPISIAVEGEAHAGSALQHRPPERLEVGAAAANVDALPIWLAV